MSRERDNELCDAPAGWDFFCWHRTHEDVTDHLTGVVIDKMAIRDTYLYHDRNGLVLKREIDLRRGWEDWSLSELSEVDTSEV